MSEYNKLVADLLESHEFPSILQSAEDKRRQKLNANPNYLEDEEDQYARDSKDIAKLKSGDPDHDQYSRDSESIARLKNPQYMDDEAPDEVPLLPCGAPEHEVWNLGNYFAKKNPGFRWDIWNNAWKDAESFDTGEYKIWYLVDQQSRSGPEYVSEILGYQYLGQMLSKEQIEEAGLTGYTEQELTEELFPPDDDDTPNKYYRDFE